MKSSKTSQVLLYVVAVGAAYFGLSYLFNSFAAHGFAAAYHQRLAGGIAYGALGQPVLYHTLVGVVGALYTALAAGNVALVAGVARRERWAWPALLSLNGTALGLLLLVNLRNGLSSPWWLNAALLLLVVSAWWLDRPSRPVPRPTTAAALATIGLALFGLGSHSARAQAGPAVALPVAYAGRLSVLAGLAQPLLLRGANVSVNYGLTDNLLVQTSWGFGLNYDRRFDVADKRLYRSTSSPVTAGIGLGYRLVRHLVVWAEPGLSRYRVRPQTGGLIAYTSFSLGGSVTYNFLLGKGLTLQPAVKYWPTVASTLTDEQAHFTDPDGRTQVHRARAAGADGLIVNLSVGYTFPGRR